MPNCLEKMVVEHVALYDPVWGLPGLKRYLERPSLYELFVKHGTLPQEEPTPDAVAEAQAHMERIKRESGSPLAGK